MSTSEIKTHSGNNYPQRQNVCICFCSKLLPLSNINGKPRHFDATTATGNLPIVAADGEPKERYTMEFFHLPIWNDNNDDYQFRLLRIPNLNTIIKLVEIAINF